MDLEDSALSIGSGDGVCVWCLVVGCLGALGVEAATRSSADVELVSGGGVSLVILAACVERHMPPASLPYWLICPAAAAALGVWSSMFRVSVLSRDFDF